MEIQCANCKKTFNIPEEKLPRSSRFSFKCPACKEKSMIDLGSGQKGPAGKEAKQNEDLLAEPDYFPPGANTVLICTADEELEHRVKIFMEGKGYYTTIAADGQLASAKARLNRYDIVFVEEAGSFQPLLNEVHTWSGAVRRNTNVIMIGERVDSFNQTEAFLLAVDFYLNKRDKEKIEEYLLLCLKEHEINNELWFKALKEQENVK
ncbi:MAG: zinc-ribbon domain-containing protein [Thermodesulfobacteriota bacterium]